MEPNILTRENHQTLKMKKTTIILDLQEIFTGLLFKFACFFASSKYFMLIFVPILISKVNANFSLVVEETANWVVSDEKSNLLKSLTFAIAMSFHSLLEGFALGVQVIVIKYLVSLIS